MPAEPRQPGKCPPLVETVLGAQFDPLPKLTSAHLGAFWKRLGADWPAPRDAAFIEPEFERFGEEGAWASITVPLRLLHEPRVRLQMRRRDDSRMIQAQNGRFHYNWMGRPGGGDYPRYRNVRPEFDAALADFARFLAEEGLGELRFNQWELTYINQILKGDLWANPPDWAALFRQPGLAPFELGLSRLGTFSGEWHYELPERRGRLHVQVQHGRLGAPDGPETVTVTLTARGPAGTGHLGIGQGLDLGHDAVVAAFRELTSGAAQDHWGLRNGNG